MKSPNSPLLPLAAAAVLALAACGSGDDTADVRDTDPTAPAVSTPGDGGLRAPTPIEITRAGDAAAGAGLAAEAAADTPTGAATSDMMIAPVPFVTEFVVGPDMPALPTDDTGYVFDGSATVTAEQVEQLAAALGVAGEAVRIDEGWGVSWRVGPDDGTAPSVWVYEDAQLSWNYNSSWSEGIARSTCAVSVDSDGNETSECDEPEPPVGVPSAAEAEQLARELLTGLGEDPAAFSFDVYADEWFASVWLVNDLGERNWSFGFGAEGVLQHAGGTLATPEPVGPYPLVDLDTAVARLGDSWFGGFGGFGAIATDMVGDMVGGVAIGAPEPAIAIAEEPPVDIREGDVDGDTEMPVEPMPVEPVEPMIITLVDVEPDLWWAWDADGSVWLLPAYRFIGDDGGWYTVPAVTDEFMIRTDPIEPLPLEPGMPEPAPAPEEAEPGFDPGQDPDEVVALPEPVTPEPLPDPDIAIAELGGLLPMELEPFSVEAGAQGYSTRVAIEDGEAYDLTADYDPTRVNVAVEDGIVVAIEFLG